jgi:hypothetical protein
MPTATWPMPDQEFEPRAKARGRGRYEGIAEISAPWSLARVVAAG